VDEGLPKDKILREKEMNRDIKLLDEAPGKEEK